MSRLAAAVVIAWVPYVRTSGLGVAAAGAAGRTVDLTVGLATVAVVALLDWQRALVAGLLVAAVGLILTSLARRRLGGVTGDVCGATAELGQLAVLLVFAMR
jgi:adenosylcobinamide-GDP ribazoletransferase